MKTAEEWAQETRPAWCSTAEIVAVIRDAQQEAFEEAKEQTALEYNTIREDIIRQERAAAYTEGVKAALEAASSKAFEWLEGADGEQFKTAEAIGCAIHTLANQLLKGETK